MIASLLLAVATQAPPGPPVVVAVADPEPVRLTAGGRAEARVVATIRQGFRIQANPASEPYLVPALLSLPDDGRVRVGLPRYPSGKPHRLRGATSDLSIYEGTFVVRVSLEATSSSAETTTPVDLVLEGTLRYQACNDVVCLRPSSVAVRVPVRIGPPLDAAER